MKRPAAIFQLIGILLAAGTAVAAAEAGGDAEHLVPFSYLVLAMGAAAAVTGFCVALVFVLIFRRRTYRWKQIVSALPVHCSIVDRDGRVRFQHLPWDIIQRLSRPVRRVEDFPEEVVSAFRDPVLRVFETGKPYAMEYMLAGKRNKVEFRRFPARVFGREAVICLSFDVDKIRRTRQEEIERELAKTSRLLQTIMDNLPCAVFVKNPDDDYRYIMANRTFATFVGLPVEEVPEKTDYDLFTRSADAAASRVSDSRAVETGEVVDNWEIIMGGDRKVRMMHCVKSTVDYGDGQRLLLGIYLDVTAQEEAERELSRTSRLLQTIMDNLPCAVFVKDPDDDYRYIMANHNFASFIGVAGREMPGKTDFDLFIRPADAAGCRKSDSRAVESGEVVDCKEVVMGGDGNIYTLRCVKATVDYDDGQRLLMGICLDVTPQEEAERQLSKANHLLQAILENMPMAFWVKDPDDDFRYMIANRALHALLDQPPGSMIGRTDAEIAGNRHSELRVESDVAAMKQLRGLDQDETLVINDETLYLHMRRFPLDNGDGHRLLLGMGIDVTERVRSRDELQRANSILNALLNNLPALVAVKNPLAGFEYMIWNNAATEITGYPASEIIGHRPEELQLPLLQIFESPESDLAVSNGKQIDRVYELSAPERPDLFLKTVKTRIPLDAENSLILTLGIDITEQKLMENQLTALTDSLKSYIEQEQIISSTLEGVALSNDDEAAVIPQVLELLGTRLAVDDCCLFSFKDDPPRAEAIFEFSPSGKGTRNCSPKRLVLENNEPWIARITEHQVVELPDLTSDEAKQLLGTWRDCMPPLTEDSAFYGIGVRKEDRLWGYIGLLFLHEKRELKDLERALLRSAAHIIEIILERQRHRAELARSEYEKLIIMDSIRIPIMLFDTDLKLIQANNAAISLVNTNEAQEPDEEECVEYPTSDGIYYLPMAVLNRDTGNIRGQEIRFRGRDFLLSSYPIEIGDRLAYLLKTMVDVTDYNEVRRKLVAALAAEESANKAKSYFLATVSHELRTPLNVVIGFTDLLKQGGMTPMEQIDSIQSINLAGNALLNLINDVLDLSKIEAGQMEITPHEVDIAKLLKEIMAIFSYKAKQKGLDFELEIQSGMPPMLIDSLRLRQILLNVVGNALKFTNHGYVRIKAEYEPEDADPAYATLNVRVIDSGVGVAPEFQARIFEPFVQQRTASERNQEGTGLGLAITSRLVEKMGGEITLDSEVGKGSTFTVRLRHLRRATESSPSAPSGEERAAGGAGKGTAAPVVSGGGGAPPDILIVDDMAVNLKVLAAMLQKLKLSCRTAISGAAALKAIQEKVPDLVLTDLWMPKMTGSELAARIRKDPKCSSIRIVAVTADTESRTNFDMTLFDDIFLKPVTLERLRRFFEASDAPKQ